MHLFGIGRKKEKKDAKVIEPKVVVQNSDWDQIVCPYCFEKFSHKDVHFRAGTVTSGILSDEEIEDRYSDNPEKMEKELKEAAVARKFMLQKHDEKLEKFWKKFGITPDQRDDKEWNKAVITAEDKDMLYHNNVNDDGLGHTKDGFLSRVTDVYGVDSTVRLCPYCHNKLSSTYGKNKTIFISIVGITGSGKTVYLNQLLESLQTHLACAGLVASEPFNLRPNEIIAKNNFLPMSTQEGILYPPMMINIIKKGAVNSQNAESTLVFYDIAGENCTETDKLYKFGPYLKKSQAVIMLMDPKQFKFINNNANINPISNVVNALISFYETSGLEKAPLIAATISKSDQLKEITNNFLMADYLNDDSVIFQKINWNPQKRGFYAESYKQMQGAMINLMKGMDPNDLVMGQLKQYFTKAGLFAVSALGVPVQAKFNIETEQEPLYIDIDEEAEKAITMLKRPAKEGYIQEPGMYMGRKQVLLGQNPETKEDVVWSFDQIRKSTSNIVYWMNQDPDPYRIEEPLLWTLSELGIINKIEA